MSTTSTTLTPQRVHLVFKTHLDVGFTDLAARVKQKYFSSYIPSAIELAKVLRDTDGPESYVWTTGSWLIYEYLEHASTSDRARLEEAIIAGDIVWHGLPFSTHSELMDPSLFRFGLSISKELDRRFGKTTVAAKMTDVPGHTRGIVPLLAEAGIRLLHIGVNPSSMPPDVPPAFLWRNTDGSEVIVLYQKGGYGDLSALPGVSGALAFAFTSDNVGPHIVEQVREIFRSLRDRYPGVPVASSTLDAFARDLMESGPELPVVTEEIGDTWIHGTGTDPTKIRRYRELCRVRNEWVSDGSADAMGAAFTSFSRHLLLVPEHTWGLDEKTHLADNLNYSAADFASARKGENYKRMEASWSEQRGFLDEALGALGDSSLAAFARSRLADTEPAIPSSLGHERVGDPDAPIETERFSVGFDPADGAIIRLVDKESGRDWAGEGNALARFTYEVFSQDDYDRFLDHYQYPKERAQWFVNDFSKPGMAAASPDHRRWRPRLDTMWTRRDGLGVHVILELSAPSEAAVEYGCPARLFVEALFPTNETAVHLTAQWSDKNACRLPEAIWLSFSPRVLRARGWSLDKLGQQISPLEVVRNGNRKLHAVGMGVEYRDGRGALAIESLDAPLVAPGEMSLLDFNNKQPPLARGMHFNLYNNVWGTNFPMWFEEDARFRFVLKFTSAS